MENEFPFRKSLDKPKPITISQEQRVTELLAPDPLSAAAPSEDKEISVDQEENFSEEPRRTNRAWKPNERVLEHLAHGVEGGVLAQPNPATFKEAMLAYDCSSWKQAIQSEILSHLKNQTFEKCEVPAGQGNSSWVGICSKTER